MSYGNEIAVRYNFQKIAPLGIEDYDYPRIAAVLNLDVDYVKCLCENYHVLNKQRAESYVSLLPKAKKPERICFIGDSLTSDRLSYLHVAEEVFANDSNVSIMDFSISGWNTTNVLFEFESTVIPFNPTIIHFLIGINDARNAYPGEDGSATSIDGYQRNMQRLIRYAKALGADVIVSSLHPVARAIQPLPNGKYAVWETELFNTVLESLCSEEKVCFNDMRSAQHAQTERIIDDFDNLHLNVYGQDMIATHLIPLIGKLISKRNAV